MAHVHVEMGKNTDGAMEGIAIVTTNTLQVTSSRVAQEVARIDEFCFLSLHEAAFYRSF